MYNNNTLCCHWCGIDLSRASQIVYLNGNLPICGLCLIKAQQGPYLIPSDKLPKLHEEKP